VLSENFVRGARIADRVGAVAGTAAGSAADAESVAIDLSALADAGLLFRDPSRRGSGDADLIGRAVVGGRR
jgi:hypothetical protein